MAKVVFTAVILFTSVLGFIALFIEGGYTKEPIRYDMETESKIQEPNNNCKDCGEAGWQRMKEKCSTKILDKNYCKQCLSGFNWSGVDATTDINEIEEGYIEIDSGEVLDKPTPKSIKVFIYHQWAVDEEGNLYLHSELG